MIERFQQQPMAQHTKQLLITMEISRLQGNMKEGNAYQLKNFKAIFLLDFLRTAEPPPFKSHVQKICKRITCVV
jgi:hypothetical protein